MARIARKRVVFGDTGPSDAGFDVVRLESDYTGPTLALVAGVHGCEYTAMVALRDFLEQAPARLRRGRIVTVPFADEASFEARRPFVCPVDGRNLARQFPGQTVGSHSQQLAAALWAVWKDADLVVDLHSGDLGETLVPFVLFHAGCPGADTARNAAACFADIAHRVAQAGEGLNGTTSQAMAAAGRPALIVEGGGDGRIDHAAAGAICTGLHAVLDFLGMTNTPPDAVSATQTEWGNLTSVVLTNSGWWTPHVQAGYRVSAGAQLGIVQPIHGEPSIEVLSPVTGVVLYSMTSPAGRSGDVVAGIASGEVAMPAG